MPRRPVEYLRLRSRMLEMGVGNKDLCAHLDRETTYITLRLTGKRPWSQDDMYKTCQLLEVPLEDVFSYFPPRKGTA